MITSAIKILSITKIELKTAEKGADKIAEAKKLRRWKSTSFDLKLVRIRIIWKLDYFYLGYIYGSQ